MRYITEPAREIPVAIEADLCVVGGSCTGVFAAVRAARLGLRVALIEGQNCFGGTATAGLVNIWHSMYDMDFSEKIIAGLSDEIRFSLLKSASATEATDVNALRFNPVALEGALDDLVMHTPGIIPLLSTYYAGVSMDGEKIECVFVQNKDGRSAIVAGFFVDATGDGDLLRDAGVPRYVREGLQPPTSCFLLNRDTRDELIADLILRHGSEVGLDDDWGWFGPVPGMPGVTMRADNHVFGRDLLRAEERTRAEMEGRKKALLLEKLLKKYVSGDYAILNLCSSIGIRETAHFSTRFTATADALLRGDRYKDAVLRGTYRVDIHHHADNGITFLYLDGRKQVFYGKSNRQESGYWKEGGPFARYYELPFSALVQEKVSNLIGAGRMLNADEGGYGALRVMINLNQLGEAAGVAAYLAVDGGCAAQELDGARVRETMKRGGSAL